MRGPGGTTDMSGGSAPAQPFGEQEGGGDQPVARPRRPLRPIAEWTGGPAPAHSRPRAHHQKGGRELATIASSREGGRMFRRFEPAISGECLKPRITDDTSMGFRIAMPMEEKV